MVEQLQEELRYMDAMDAVQQGVSNGLDEIAKYVLSQARVYIREKDLVGVTGQLSTQADVDLSDPLTKIVYFRAKYAPYMEFGTGPAAEDAQPKYMPPLEPLVDWCRAKGIQFEPRDGSGGTLTYEQTAEAIRWHIYHYGIDPKPFFRPAIHDGEVKKVATIQKHVNKSLREAGMRAGTSG